MRGDVRVFRARGVDRKDVGDHIAGERDGVMFEDHARRFDRNDPARFEK